MSTPTPAAPIEIGTILNRVIDTYSATARVLLPGALVVFLPVALVAAAAAGSAGGGLLAALVAFVASVWFAGMVARTVQDVQDGRVDASLGELFSSVTPVLGQLMLLGIVAGVAIGVGLVLLIVPGLILLTIWAVATPVVVIEERGALEALGRSRELVRGNGWTVFGVIVSIFAGLFVLSAVVGSIGAVGDSFALQFVVQLALNVAVAPVSALAITVLYFALTGAEPAPVAASAPAGEPSAPQPAAPQPVGFPPGPGSTPPPATRPPAGRAPAPVVAADPPAGIPGDEPAQTDAFGNPVAPPTVAGFEPPQPPAVPEVPADPTPPEVPADPTPPADDEPPR